jgi:hypothetical protein
MLRVYRYCSVLSRQMQLTSSFREKEDAEGVQLCKNLDTEEGLSDIKAVIELKYPQDSSEGVKPGGRKMPVRQSRYKVCMQAGLHKLVSNFCITPKELCQNLEGTKKHHPPDPAGTQFSSSIPCGIEKLWRCCDTRTHASTHTHAHTNVA